MEEASDSPACPPFWLLVCDGGGSFLPPAPTPPLLLQLPDVGGGWDVLLSPGVPLAAVSLSADPPPEVDEATATLPKQVLDLSLDAVELLRLSMSSELRPISFSMTFRVGRDT